MASTDDFIELYEDALPPAVCTALVARFGQCSAQVQRGQTGSGVDTALKDSWDIPLDAHPADWADVRDTLNQAAMACLKRYLRRHPMAVLSALRLQLPDPTTGVPQALTPEAMAALPDAQLTQVVAAVLRPGSINLQKYMADQGGYPYWHSEIYPRLDQGEALHRLLLWTIYLNDGFEAGETEFLHQARRVRPRTGALLIAPAGFTHTHRGNRPRGGDKYIATSWILFRRAEAIYGAPAHR